MFTSRRATRALALALTATAATAGAAAAAPIDEPGDAVASALAAEQYYSSYGTPTPSAVSKPPADGAEWPIVGLVGAGGMLLAVGAGTVIRRSRVGRGAPA